MSASENRRQYLAWMRTNFPRLYDATVLTTVSNHLSRASAGGLGDLTDSDVADISWLTDYTPTLDVASDTSSSPSIWDSISSNAGSLFDTILGTAAKVAPAYVQTDAQLQLLNINTQRAKQGLPPLTYLNGQQVTASGLAPASPAINGVESALSTIPSSWFMFGGFALLGVLLVKMSGRRR